MRIHVPAGRRLQFFDADGNPLAVPESVQLVREIDLPGEAVPAEAEAVSTETPGQVLANRVGVTGGLFAAAIGGALLLGRARR